MAELLLEISFMRLICFLFILFPQIVVAGLIEFDLKVLRQDAEQQLRRRFILDNTEGFFYIKEKAYRIKPGSRNLSYEGDLYYVLNDSILAKNLHLAAGYSIYGGSNLLGVRRWGKNVSEIDGMAINFTHPLSFEEKNEVIYKLHMVSRRALEMDAFLNDSYVTFNWNWNLPVSLQDLKQILSESEQVEYIRPLIYRDFTNTWVRYARLGSGKRSRKIDLKDILKLRDELEQKNFRLPKNKGINFFNPLNCHQILSEI